MSTIQDLMNSIANMEGWNVQGSIAQRNNNPGNLRYAPNQIGSENTVNGTFATFATPQDGWNALQSYVESKQASGVTLRDFIYTYAPPSENNTSNYLNYLSSQLGIGADTPLSQIGGADVASIGGATDSLSNYSSVLDNLLQSGDTTKGLVVLAGVGLVVGALLA